MRYPKNDLVGLVSLIAGLIALLLLVPGLFDARTPPPLRVVLGWGAYVAVAALLLGGIVIVLVGGWGRSVHWGMIALGELFFLLLLILTHIGVDQPLQVALAGQGGGLAGWAGSRFLIDLAGNAGAWGITLAATLVVAWFLLHDLLLSRRDPYSNRLARWIQSGREAVPHVDLGNWSKSLLAGLREFVRKFGLSPGGPSGSGDGQRSSSAAETTSSLGKGSRSRGASSASDGLFPTEKTRQQPVTSRIAADGGRASRPKLRSGKLPPLDLLKSEEATAAGSADVRHRAQTLKQTLAEFGVPVEIVSIKEGPTVTQFGLEPGEVVRELRSGEIQRRRVSVHSILRLGNDLALALAAPSIRIEAPVPGRPYVGVEVPNTAKTLVSLRSILESKEFARAGSPLAVAIGRDVSGDPVVVDLTAMPHLLIAGATGSGKSVCINAIVCSLLMNNDPAIVRFVMVDPKMVELPAYNDVPHLVGPVITDPVQVPQALAWLTLQMDDRYRILADSGARNIGGYNRKAARSRSIEPLPYILLVIDELADLMMASGYDIERQICRLAQMSRATGVHLVLATQRPSVDVITGLIKANFPARIAFAVTAQIDSRVILDVPGAEKLLGRGDMLFMAPDSVKLSRIQGCFVSDREIDRIVDFWKTSCGTSGTAKPASAPWAGLLHETNERDQLLEQALELLRTKSRVSTSILQRNLRIGFPRAARLMEQLEEMGTVGPDEGGGRSREVLIGRGDALDAKN